MLAVATIFSLTQLPNHFYLSPTSGMWVSEQEHHKTSKSSKNKTARPALAHEIEIDRQLREKIM
jgi:hypothetical protein